MARVSYNYVEGHPDGALPTLRRRVGQYTRNVGEFKIGRTSTPEARANQPDYADGYDEMIVIYKTNSAAYVNDVERDLIDYFNAHDDNRNFRGGGGGPLGRAPYYVYLVRSKTLVNTVLNWFK